MFEIFVWDLSCQISSSQFEFQWPGGCDSEKKTCIVSQRCIQSFFHLIFAIYYPGCVSMYWHCHNAFQWFTFHNGRCCSILWMQEKKAMTGIFAKSGHCLDAFWLIVASDGIAMPTMKLFETSRRQIFIFSTYVLCLL